MTTGQLILEIDSEAHKKCHPASISAVVSGWNNLAVYYLGGGECLRHLPYKRID